MDIIKAEEMQALEQCAFLAGSSPEKLMEEAVTGILKDWQLRFPNPGQAWFFCGKGNNGNDGLWIADSLRKLGWQTEIILSHPEHERAHLNSIPIKNSLARAMLWPELPNFSNHFFPKIIVDALLGIGAVGLPHGVYGKILEQLSLLQTQASYSISLDIPSGLDPNEGISAAHTFHADITYTIGRVKLGLLKDCARPYVGRIVRIPISLNYPELNHTEKNRPQYFDFTSAQTLVKALPASSYKGQRGALHLYAGSEGMDGAAVLASHSGLKSGAGLVRLFSHSSRCNLVHQLPPEIMTSKLSSAVVPELFYQAKAWVIGPGIGVTEENKKILMLLLSTAPCPIVLDADALTLIASDLSLLNLCSQPVILTPHVGELERLLQKPVIERQQVAFEWVEQYPKTILIIKGPNTIVAADGSALSFNASGNPGMATAGMGDVLSGVIGSLLAQGHTPCEAARLGVYWHGKAADDAAQKMGEHCLTASDVITFLPSVWQNLIKGKIN